MSQTDNTTLASRIESARRQLAWMPLDTLLGLVKDAKAGLEIEEGFVVELCESWHEFQPTMSMPEIEANARAVMLLARHGA